MIPFLSYKDLGRVNREFVLCWLPYSRVTEFEVSGNTDSILCSVLVHLQSKAADVYISLALVPPTC